jgi:hypothetical protein
MTRDTGIGKGMDSPGFLSRYGQKIYCAFPNFHIRLWGPPSPPVNGYREPFPTVRRPGLDAHSRPSSAFMGRAETGGDTAGSSRVVWTVDGTSCHGNTRSQPAAHTQYALSWDLAGLTLQDSFPNMIRITHRSEC